MKKFMLLATVVAVVVVALALPALAGERGNNNRWDNNNNRWENHYKNWWQDHYKNWWEDNNKGNNNKAAAPVVAQKSTQQAQSGDVSQSFTVTGGGDNSNQCAGIQGVSNTGNAQNQISVVQNGSEADDFSFEDSGASINVSPSNSTRCEQQVNQAATAYYGGGGGK